MKNQKRFKLLIEILFISTVLVVIAIALAVPFNLIEVKEDNFIIENWTYIKWADAIISLLIFSLFLRGLYFLRNVAGVILKNQQFSLTMSKSLNRSGWNFVLAGLLHLLLTFTLWINHLMHGELKFGIDSDTITPFFLMIVGVFFMIQSETIQVATAFKEENDLTV